MSERWVSDDGAIELRLGRWQDVLGDVECDAVITDPPYSEKTHAGHNRGIAAANAHGEYVRREIDYAPWSRADLRELAAHAADHCRGWVVGITDDCLAPQWQEEMAAIGRYTFAPLPLVKIGGRVRLTGDGPSAWTTWIVVSRPRTRPYSAWGTLPGAYVISGAIERLTVAGGKPLEGMRAIIRDYSRPGDLICDPCAGGATTLLAARMEGRRAIGAEMDPETFRKAVDRLEKACRQRDLFAHEDLVPAEQRALALGDDDAA